MSNTWHRFQETIEGDDECGRCHAVVSIEAQETFTLPCPIGDCTSPNNPDRGCVFAPSRSGVCRCVYCGRPGGRLEDMPPEDLEPDELDPDAET